MSRKLLLVLLLATGVAFADDAPAAKHAKGAAAAKEKAKPAEDQAKADPAKAEEAKGKDDSNLGMSILGNQEAPKALVIVPWKRSEMGGALGVSTLLDDSRSPVDKEVFMRMLSYYEIRSETEPHGGAAGAGRETAPVAKNAAQPAPAAHK